jgi:Tol biopolymer transport system component
VDLITGAKGPRLVERPVSGGAVRDLAAPPGIELPLDVSRDGKTLLFNRGSFDTAVFSFRLDGVKEDSRSLLQTGEILSNTTFSPDGNWIVYQTSGRGSEAIYVQPFPGPGLKRTQIASSGNWPVWRKDGREIVYLDQYQGRDYIWSVSVTQAGSELHASPPVPLFPVRLPASTFPDLNFLALSHDGSRFYIPQAEQPGSDAIHVRMGWAK